MFRIAYIVSHPIQYQAALLRYLSHAPEIDLQVFFLSDFSLHDHYEKGYQQRFKWDVELTEGYKWECLHRAHGGHSLRSWWPIARWRHRLSGGDFDAVWVHGWGHLGLCDAVREASALGIPVLMRGDSTTQGDAGSLIRRRFRRWFYRWLFQRIAGFLCVGTRNREFYRENGAPEERLFSVLYAVDNQYFQIRCSQVRSKREELRRSLGLETGRPIAVFAGRIAPVKGPDELLNAFTMVARKFQPTQQPYLLYVGDGPMRRDLENRAKSLVNSVRFLGFRNQSDLPALYDLCDVFVLPSRFEPWGLVVNEVMNASRPVIVSDRVGCGPDLVINGDNGFIYSSGHTAALASRLEQVLTSPDLCVRMGERSLKRISSWNFEANRRGLLKALSTVCQKRVQAADAIAL